MRTETLGESPQRRTEDSAIPKMANPCYRTSTPCIMMGQIVEQRSLRLASNIKMPAQTC